MNKLKIVLLGLVLTLACVFNSNAQIVTGNLFLQGRYLEIGAQANASLGSGIAAPIGYHPRTGGAVFLCGGSSSSLLASVYDFGLDGWTVGTPNYMGDYTLPGSPWEGWGIEVNGVREWAYSTNCNLSGGLGAAIGSWTTHSTTGGRVIGNWSGSFLTGQLQIRKEYRVDTLSSSLVITVKLYNTGATPLNNVYYMRSCDPDQSVPWGGSFVTDNTIRFQNDFYHRVMVSAIATGGTGSTGTPPAALALGTKDSRAKCLIYNSWPLPTGATYSSIWAGTSTGIGTSYYNINTGTSSDVAIALVFNLCNIPAGDSTSLSYAYIYNGASSMTAALDTAFPEPKLLVNGVAMDSVDTVTTCIAASGIADLQLSFASDKSWTWSKWTWSPSIGLSSITGTINTLTMSSVTSVTTYTITSIDTGVCIDRQKTFLLTVLPVLAASPITRDTIYCQNQLAAPLSAGVAGIGTLKWYITSTGGTGVTISPTPSTTDTGTYTWWVSQTISGCESTRVPIKVKILPTYIDTILAYICLGDTYEYNGNYYESPGVYPTMFSTINGCDSLIRVIVTVFPTDTIVKYDSICAGDSILFAGSVYYDNGIHSKSFINQFGCDSTVILNLKVIPIPSVAIDIYPKPWLCKGDSIQITAYSQINDVQTYYWNFTGGTFLNSSINPAGPYTYSYNDSGTYQVKLVVKNTLCYSDTVSKIVKVQLYPDARISPLDTEYCLNDEIEFKPLNIKPDVTYKWVPIDYFPYQDFGSQKYITGIMVKQGFVGLHAYTSYGCMTIDSIAVFPRSCCKFTVPTAFTPNGDGKNDLFKPLGDKFIVQRFSVYNRWGQEVYVTRYKTPFGWDGTFEGKPADIGVYYWVAFYDCEGEGYIEKGEVTLIR
jgi:gliding motility-associated-like protein